MALTTNLPLLTASINGSGGATFSITPSATLRATADVSGDGAFYLSATATVLPTNDASPLRTGLASFSFSGSLVPYAIGVMQGSTADSGTLTTDTIAAAVWSALADQNNADGSMGAKLNMASSGGVDYAALGQAVWGRVIEAGYSADQIMRLLAAHAAGSAENLEGTTPQFTGLDGATVRIAANYATGTRTITSLNGD